jgi:sigma54-dependent transcription regulator
MKTLFSFTGFHDPYSIGLLGEEELGPILSLVQSVGFDQIILFGTPNTARNTADTASALHARHSGIVVEVRELPLTDPTDYIAILRELRKGTRHVVESQPRAEFYVAVASGTPQMHACWLLLVAAGEVPARILHVRPQRFVSAKLPIVSEVDLSDPAFPVVRKQIGVQAHMPSGAGVDPSITARDLGIVADHPQMQQALEIAAMLASSSAPILILGETGTGKELMARYVLARS